MIILIIFVKKNMDYPKDFIENNKELYNEFMSKWVEYRRFQMIDNPTVYISKYTNKDGKSYLTARTTLPITPTKNKQIRVYVGKLEDFKEGVRDDRAKLIGKEKVRKRLKSFV